MSKKKSYILNGVRRKILDEEPKMKSDIIKGKKILFFGVGGNIGKRHLKILQDNYECDIYAYRTNLKIDFNSIIQMYGLSALQYNKP